MGLMTTHVKSVQSFWLMFSVWRLLYTTVYLSSAQCRLRRKALPLSSFASGVSSGVSAS